MTRTKLPKCSTPEHSYLGHFRKPDILRAGHNTDRLLHGLTEAGNIDLKNRPQVETPEGVATVRSMTINEGDTPVLIPTISRAGKPMEPREAIDEYQRTGEHLGKFRDERSAESFARRLHEEQKRRYGR